jgi:hypothetical protein
MRDAGLAGGGAERQPLHALAFQDRLGGLQQGIVQIAVMVGLAVANYLSWRRFMWFFAQFLGRFHHPVILRHFYTVKIFLDGCRPPGYLIFTM